MLDIGYVRLLPTRVVWMGLIANTVIHAGAFGAIFMLIAWCTGFNRVRRGKCRKCAYILVDQERCPECGTDCRTSRIHQIRVPAAWLVCLVGAGILAAYAYEALLEFAMLIEMPPDSLWTPRWFVVLMPPLAVAAIVALFWKRKAFLRQRKWFKLVMAFGALALTITHLVLR